MIINTVGNLVEVTLENPYESMSLPDMIGRGWPHAASGQLWEISYPFPDEGYTYCVNIDNDVDTWSFYAIADNGYTPPFAKLAGEGVNATLVGALCRLLRGGSEDILMKMHDAHLFAEGL